MLFQCLTAPSAAWWPNTVFFKPVVRAATGRPLVGETVWNLCPGSLRAAHSAALSAAAVGAGSACARIRARNLRSS